MGGTPSRNGLRIGAGLAALVVALLAVAAALGWLDSGDTPPADADADPPSIEAATPRSETESESDEGPDDEPASERPEIVQARNLEASADLARQKGELATALRQYRQALDLWRETGRAMDELACLTRLTGTLLDRGEISDAATRLAAAEILARDLKAGDVRAARAAILFQKGRLAALRGELDVATTLHEEALDLRQRSDLDAGSLQSRLALARLDLDTGLPDRAELLAREAREQAEAGGHTAEAVQAKALVIEALVEDGREAEAAEVSTGADGYVDAVEARLELELARAALAAATLPNSSSRTEIATVLDRFDRIAAEAAGYGLRPLALRIRLRQAGVALERSSDRRDEALGRLRVVETEARAAGLHYFADRAKIILEYEA